MPYLTRTRQGPTATGLGTGLGVPGVAHPLLAPDEWNRLSRPGTPLHWVVLNVADGPGVQPDPHCLEAVLRNAGVRVLGHIDTAYGLRGFGEIISDAHRHLDWYQVDGFFLDRCPSGREDLPEVRRTVATLRVIHEDAHVVLGHGTHPTPATPSTPTSSSPTPARGATTAGRRRPSGPPTIRPSGSAISCTACPGRTWRRRCASPAGTAPTPSGSPTTPTASPAAPDRRIRGAAARLLGRHRLACRNGCLGMKKGMAVLSGEQPY